MTTLTFHNNSVQLHELWYSSHQSLIMRMCIELNMVDRIEEFTNKFLGKKMKMKVLKDPLKPSRPKSSFLFFCDDKRPEVIENYKKKNDNKVNMGGVSKILGKMWQSLDSDEKNKYILINETDKKRYQQEMEDYSCKYN